MNPLLVRRKLVAANRRQVSFVNLGEGVDSVKHRLHFPALALVNVG